MILGIDFGTSGVRGCVRQGMHTDFFSVAYPQLGLNTPTHTVQDPKAWVLALEALLAKIPLNLRQQIQQIILDATSSTVLLAESKNGQVRACTQALMYNHQSAKREAATISEHIHQRMSDPIHAPESTLLGPASTLAKVLWLQKQTLTNRQRLMICHQIDWMNGYLTGQYQITDENSALKLGFNPITRSWPAWISEWIAPLKLPKVRPAGSFLAPIRSEVAQQFSLPKTCKIYCGTTDSIAAFLATGAHQLGDGVTSLGSTLAIKLLTNAPVYQPDAGVYSHRLKKMWLVGGASNTGGAVLLKHFKIEELVSRLSRLEQKLADGTYSIPTGLDYYPLIEKGERFPIFDPDLAPKLTPKPKDDDLFLLGLIEGLVNIEKLAYQKLNLAMHADTGGVKRIYSVGGGIKNQLWQKVREEILTHALSVINQKPLQTEAAFGVTQLLEPL